MVSSSSCCGVCRVACFHGILKRMASRSIHTRPGYRPLSTWATSQGFSRTRRGVTDILTGETKHKLSQNSADSTCESATALSLFRQWQKCRSRNPTNPDFPNIKSRTSTPLQEDFCHIVAAVGLQQVTLSVRPLRIVIIRRNKELVKNSKKLKKKNLKKEKTKNKRTNAILKNATHTCGEPGNWRRLSSSAFSPTAGE